MSLSVNEPVTLISSSSLLVTSYLVTSPIPVSVGDAAKDTLCADVYPVPVSVIVTPVTMPLVNTAVAVALVPATAQVTPPSVAEPLVCTGAITPDIPLPPAV